MATAAVRTAAPQRFRLRPFPTGPGAEVEGIAVPAIDDATFPAIYDAFLRHQLLLFRDQELPPGDQVAFARRFGEVQVHVMNQYHNRRTRALRAVQPRPRRQAERPASRPGHDGLAHRRLMAAAHHQGDHALCAKSSPRAAAAPALPTCARRSRRCRARAAAARRAAGGAQSRLLAQPAARRGADDRGAACRRAAGRAAGRADPSRDRTQGDLSRRPCREASSAWATTRAAPSSTA